jgi:transposase
MGINIEQYNRLKHLLPVQRGNVTVDNMTFINALLYICENGCKWRRLPKEYGNWHVIYKRFHRWVKAGIIEKLFRELHVQRAAELTVLKRLLDSMTVPVHPDACGALKKNGVQAIGRSKGGLTTKIHMVSANDRIAIAFLLSAGQLHDAPQGRLLLETIGTQKFEQNFQSVPLLMDRAYEDNATRYIAQQLYFTPVVPPKKNRKDPWDYDKKLYKLRNEIERLFRLLQGFRRVFCRFDKLDVIYAGFIMLALIFISLK